jgi:hypothetical protein
MNKKQFLTYGAIALLSATAAPRLTAADVEVKGDVDLPKTETRVRRDSDVIIRTDVDRDHAKVRHSNKASGLIGMEVRNNENQKLGEIKDLVLENPGKVSYAVLAVGGFLGIGEKLIAIPPSALKVATDGEYLILNADKAKIQAAPGFAATAWPSVNDPEFNRFWNDISATGAPATTERSRRSDIDVDVDKDKNSIKSEVNIDKDRKSKIYTDADKDKKVKIEVDKNQ